jgi:superfamily II DNA/RNA helicase
MSKQSFADLGVSGAVCGALSRRGITAPFPVQQLVLQDVLAGHDVLVKAPTGSGKTLAFGIPLAERVETGPAPSALVLAPTRELAAQIVAELEDLAAAKGLRVAAVYGGVGITAQAARAKRAHILVATPGRLEDLLARGTFTLQRIGMLVLDEADRMLDMGFRRCSSLPRSTGWSATSPAATPPAQSFASTVSRVTTRRRWWSIASSRSAMSSGSRR